MKPGMENEDCEVNCKQFTADDRDYEKCCNGSCRTTFVDNFHECPSGRNKMMDAKCPGYWCETDDCCTPLDENGGDDDNDEDQGGDDNNEDEQGGDDENKVTSCSDYNNNKSGCKSADGCRFRKKG